MTTTLSQQEHNEIVLQTLTEISTQQKDICLMLNEIVGTLNQEQEISLIDEISALLDPLYRELQDIKNQLNPSTNDSQDTAE